MREVAEELLAERVVPHVLDRTATVRIGMRDAQLLLGCPGKPLQQQGLDGVIPRQINEFLVREYRVRGRVCSPQREDQQNSHFAGRSPQSLFLSNADF
jgi:hypothetical protein